MDFSVVDAEAGTLEGGAGAGGTGFEGGNLEGVLDDFDLRLAASRIRGT